jgi:hypothetical protein
MPLREEEMADVKVYRTVAGSWFYLDRSFGLFWSRHGDHGGPILFAMNFTDPGATFGGRVALPGFGWAASETDARRKAAEFFRLARPGDSEHPPQPGEAKMTGPAHSRPAARRRISEAGAFPMGGT